jgi:hypothetical protein
VKSRDARYFREKAQQLREAAQGQGTELSRKLLGLAEEFEHRANEIESNEPKVP